MAENIGLISGSSTVLYSFTCGGDRATTTMDCSSIGRPDVVTIWSTTQPSSPYSFYTRCTVAYWLNGSYSTKSSSQGRDGGGTQYYTSGFTVSFSSSSGLLTLTSARSSGSYDWVSIEYNVCASVY